MPTHAPVSHAIANDTPSPRDESVFLGDISDQDLARRRPAAKAGAVPKRPRKAPPPFDAVAARELVATVLSKPPAQGHITRPVPVGDLIGSWVLPLHLCPGINVLAEMPDWARGKLKKAALKLMLAQSNLRRALVPLQGRPMVRCMRLSSVEPDEHSGWSKIPVDRLCVGTRKRPKSLPEVVWKQIQAKAGPVGLGWLRDDKPSALALACWWEPAPPGEGCVYIELRTGA